MSTCASLVPPPSPFSAPSSLSHSLPRHPLVVEQAIDDFDLVDFQNREEQPPSKLIHSVTQLMPTRRYVKIAEACAKMLLSDLPAQAIVSTLITAGAPYIHVGRHLFWENHRPQKISNDHSLLGIRSAIRLAKNLPPELARLPFLQAAWFFPKGIDICGQAPLPGFYGGYGDTLHALRTVLGFMGVTRYPQQSDWDLFPVAQSRFSCEMTPILQGNPDARLNELIQSIFNMDPETSLRLFLGLSQIPQMRSRLKSELLFVAFTDQQERIAGGSLGTQQHPTVRARDLFDIGDFSGWENSTDLAFSVIPDMAFGPRHYELHDLVATTCHKKFGQNQAALEERNQLTFSAVEKEEFMRYLVGNSSWEVSKQVTALISKGIKFSEIMDSMVIAAARLITLQELMNSNPLEAVHVFDHVNTLNSWMRECQHTRKLYALYFAALYIHHSIPPDESVKFAEQFAAWSDIISQRDLRFSEFETALASHDVAKAVAIARAAFDDPHQCTSLLQKLVIHFAKAQDNPHHHQAMVAALEELQYAPPSTRQELILMLAAYGAGIRSEDTVWRIHEKFFRSGSVSRPTETNLFAA